MNDVDSELLPLREISRILSAVPKGKPPYKSPNSVSRLDMMKLLGMVVGKNRNQSQRKQLEDWIAGVPTGLTPKWHSRVSRLAKMIEFGLVEKRDGKIIFHETPQRKATPMWDLRLETVKVGGRPVLNAKITPKPAFSAPRTMPRDFFGGGLFGSLKLPGEK